SGHVLGPSEIVALIVTPDRSTGFICIVEDVAAGYLVLGRQIVIHAGGEVLLPRNGALSSGHVIEHAIARVGQWLVVEKGQRLRAEQGFRNDVAGDSYVQRILEHDRLLGAGVDQASEVAIAHGLSRYDFKLG